ncbi:50S ribosomal protein L21 [Patescibacteria group bacterium]
MANKLAVIKTGGKQYLVSEGDKISIEKSKFTKDKIIFSDILFYSDDKTAEYDQTKLAKKTIEAKVLKEYRAPKVDVVKFKAKKRYSRKQGHRQDLLEIEIAKL